MFKINLKKISKMPQQQNSYLCHINSHVFFLWSSRKWPLTWRPLSRIVWRSCRKSWLQPHHPQSHATARCPRTKETLPAWERAAQAQAASRSNQTLMISLHLNACTAANWWSSPSTSLSLIQRNLRRRNPAGYEWGLLFFQREKTRQPTIYMSVTAHHLYDWPIHWI